MKTKTTIKAGGRSWQHNQAPAALRVNTNLKAGGRNLQHNQSIR